MYTNKENPTGEDLVMILKGEGECSSMRTEDHPDFTKLRNNLEELGYISTQRNYWNGDCVLKEFYLNGAKFNARDRFPCAAAIEFDIEMKLRRQIDFI